MRALAPVRRPVPLRRGTANAGHAALKALLGVEQLALFESGTHALQAVLAHCAAQQSALRNQVILPAYGCPDLVTACIGAGLQPRLVDILSDGWGYCQSSLQSALSPSILAVVAVDLLGLGDESQRLRRLIQDPNVAIVQDSAQYLPRQTSTWSSDHQVFSFGRGKPLNLLGGGAATGVEQAQTEINAVSWRHLMQSRAGALLFNVTTNPWLYGLASRFPGLGIGSTRYQVPQEHKPPRQRLAQQLAVALPTWRQYPSYSVSAWQPYLTAWQALGIRRLRTSFCDSTPTEPLRLALTAESTQLRDQLVTALCKAGLGASRLYGSALPQISGMPSELQSRGPYPAAQALAKQLFTLPTHAGLNARAAEDVDRIVRRIAGSAR